jgi:putative ABC transport system permease protein
VAEDKGLAIGDELTIEFPDESTEQVTVSGIFEENRVFQTPYMIDLDLYAQHVNTGDFFLGATVAEGADPDEVKTDVTAVAALTGSSIVQDTGEYQETVEGQVDGFVTLLNYLLAFALVVAFLGVVNTIVLSVVERTREIGLLRAVGMTRRQVRATIRWESVIVCLFGAVLGIVVGVLFATAAVSAIPDDYISNIAIPYESVLFAILVAAMAGVVAALLPARRAAKLNVLEAVASVGG